jgi:hypothetical protein
MVCQRTFCLTGTFVSKASSGRPCIQGWGLRLVYKYTDKHPQIDGQTEHANGVLEDTLQHFEGPYQTDWDEYLAVAEFPMKRRLQSKHSKHSLHAECTPTLLKLSGYVAATQ